YGKWLGKPGDKITQSLNLLLIATSLALFARGFQRINSIRTGATLSIALASFFLCSAAWSVGPGASLRQGILYLFVVIGAAGIVSNLESDDFMDLLALVCFLTGVVSLVLLFVSPGNALTSDGDFIGIFPQKNLLGQAMAIGALACLHGLRTRSRKRWRSAGMLLLITIIALESQSATSCVTIFFFCGTDALITLIRKGGVAQLLAIGAVVVLLTPCLLLAAYPESLLEMIGKDPTLTGRTDIWTYVIPDIYQKLWFGWGYEAFWSPDNPAAMEIGESLRWFAPQAHNGLLEMLLSVGLIGTAFLIFMLARNISLGVRCLRTSDRSLAISSLLCCAGIILLGITETVLLAGLEASTGVFFIIGLYCERALRLRQGHSAASRRPIHRHAAQRQTAST
ncbi:MAG TPA: O-antigen ligase, partial [Steroidobacteraceae bacterium]|nr:O-antigen ligase [Steroidobacteraceae bacterium]